MRKLLLPSFVFFIVLSATAWTQYVDSTLNNLQKVPTKYIATIDNINHCSDRIAKKTEVKAIFISP